MNVHDERRLERLAPLLVREARLDLRGLTVYTEAASGPYRWAPLLAALAGARRVYALAADSRFHRAADAARETAALAERLGLGERVAVRTEKRPAELAEADIVTNSGAVRPIDAATVAVLKPTAIVPLMWETWEFLPWQVDLPACRARGVLVLGTDECCDACDMRPFSAMLGIRLLLELGLEVNRCRVLQLGRQRLIGAPIAAALRAAGAQVTCFSRPGDGGRPYADLDAHVAAHGASYDALLAVEQTEPFELVCAGGPLAPARLAAAAPALRVGVIAGLVDADALRAAGLRVAPETLAPRGSMSYHGGSLGPRPVLQLYAAGLRVGEVAARARLAGLDVRAAARSALRDAPAMDFPGRDAWA